MVALFCFVLAILASPFKSKSRLEAENAALRHELLVLRRKVHGRVRLTNNDRWFFIQLYRWFLSILQASRSSGLRPSCSGIVPAFVATGEVASAGRAAADRGGPPRTDPADEY